MARVSETNQKDRPRNSTARQPRISMLIRRNGTWREVAFERRAYLPVSPVAATSAPQEQ
jgi:hypothetical protein